VQVHMLGQHHVTSLTAALEELRVYAHARRSTTHASGTRADFGSALATPMDLDSHRSSKPRLNNVRSSRNSRPQSRGPPRQANTFRPGPRRPSPHPSSSNFDRPRAFSGNNRPSTPFQSRAVTLRPFATGVVNAATG
jgi:hypothetical protein